MVQVIPDRIGTVEIQLLLAFAEHQQTGDVIDLRIHYHHSGDAGIADRARGLQCRVRADLRQDVGRCVDQHPVGAVRGDSDR